MTRTNVARKTWPEPSSSFTCPSIHGHRGKDHCAPRLALLLLVLGGTPLCMANSGPGIGLKVGAQTIQAPVNSGNTSRPRLDLEVSSPLLWDEHVDFAFTFGGSYFGSYTYAYRYTIE